MEQLQILNGLALVDLQVAVAQLDMAMLQAEEEDEEAARPLRRPPRPRRWWTRPWILRRGKFGHYEQLMVELANEDVQSYKNFVRMEPRMFREILDRVGPRVQKLNTNFRDALPAGLKLAITLRHMASGDSYKTLMYSFRVAHNTISKFVPEVCQAIIDEYGDEVMAVPRTPADWKRISDKFSSRWNFHHCLGAIDGKHVALRCPKNSGSDYWNYKHFHSIVLLALVDADYKFIWVSVGARGSSSDAGLFDNCDFKTALEDGTINFPQPDPLPGDDQPMPYFIIGDDAFPLRTWLMKPYSKRTMPDEERIFNYRVCRARRIVENGFGILANRYQFLLDTRKQTPERLTTMVMAACCLHNLMRTRYPTFQNQVADVEDATHNMILGEWRKDRPMHDMEEMQLGNTSSKRAKAQRGYLTAYYNSEAGSVPWQADMI